MSGGPIYPAVDPRVFHRLRELVYERSFVIRKELAALLAKVWTRMLHSADPAPGAAGADGGHFYFAHAGRSAHSWSPSVAGLPGQLVRLSDAMAVPASLSAADYRAGERATDIVMDLAGELLAALPDSAPVGELTCR